MDQTFVEFLTNFIVESDAIEGITADAELVRSQLEAGIGDGHVGAMLLLERRTAKKNVFLTQGVVRKIQRLITAEQHTKPGGPKLRPEWIGRYRNVNVSVGGTIAPPVHRVSVLMEVWVNAVVSWQKENKTNDSLKNLRRIADCHFDYEFIHPFADGNGRSGRAIVYYLMRYAGMQPFVFPSVDRFETYYRCFENNKTMREYFEARSAAS